VRQATGEEAVALAEHTRPDVVLMDVRVPGLDSVVATGRISSGVGAAVILLTHSNDDDKRVFAALRAGAGSVLLKDTQPAQLLGAIEALARGDALLSPELTRKLIAELVSRPEPACASPECSTSSPPASARVVALVGHGLTNDEIAEQLVVSPATAKTHVSRAMVKLRARDRANLVVFAYEVGLVVPRVAAPLCPPVAPRCLSRGYAGRCMPRVA